MISNFFYRFFNLMIKKLKNIQSLYCFSTKNSFLTFLIQSKKQDFFLKRKAFLHCIVLLRSNKKTKDERKR
jgi:hypothetical protein